MCGCMIYVQGCACHSMHVKISDWLYEDASNHVFCTIFKWNTAEDREFNHVAQVDLKPTMLSVSGRSCLHFTAILLLSFSSASSTGICYLAWLNFDLVTLRELTIFLDISQNYVLCVFSSSQCLAFPLLNVVF